MAGVIANGDKRVVDYSVQDNSTPVDAGDTGAAIGQLTFTTPATNNKLDLETSLSDPYHNLVVPGVVTELNYTDGMVSVTAESALTALNKWFRVKPFSGSVAAYLSYLSGLCGVVPPMLAESSVSTKQIVASGYAGNVWEGFKEFLSVNDLEASYSEGLIRVGKFGVGIYGAGARRQNGKIVVTV